MSGLVVVGGGAQAKLASEIALSDGLEVQFVVDLIGGLGPDSWPSKMGLEIVDGEVAAGRAPGAQFVACHANPGARRELVDRYRTAGFQLTSVVSSRAQVATTATVGPGAIIAAGCVIESFASIGTSFVARANSIVEHDCAIGDFVTFAPAVTLAGWVSVADDATLFTRCAVTPSAAIGAGATVGAGAVVLQDVDAGATVVGVPAREI